MINPYNGLNFIDLIIFSVYLTNILVTYARNLSGVWDEKPAIEYIAEAQIYARNYVRGYISEDAIWIFSIVILWIRVFYLIRFNQLLGRFIGVVERLFYDVALFFLFYIL
jgi:hypothetical protein